MSPRKRSFGHWAGAVLGVGTLAAGTFIFAPFGCGSRAVSEAIVVGHVAPLSGADKDAGEHARNGILLALEEAVATGGSLAGRKVVVDHADTRSDPAGIRGVTMRLLTVNKAAALLGGEELARLETLEALAEANKVPVILAACPPSRQMGDYLFFTEVPQSRQGEVLARFASNDLKLDRVALVFQSDRTALAEAFAGHFPTDKILGRWSYASAEQLKPALEALKTKAPSAVLFAGSPADLTALQALGLEGKVPLLLGGGDSLFDKVRQAPPTARPVYAVTVGADDDKLPALRAFAEKYRKRFAEPPDVNAVTGYDAARMLFDAMQKAGPGDGHKVCDALAGSHFDSLTGPMSFTPDRRVQRPAFVVEWKNGRPRVAGRFDAEEKQARRGLPSLAAGAVAR